MDASLFKRSLTEGAGTAALVLGVFGGAHFATRIGATPAEAAIIGTFAVVGTFVCVLHAVGNLTGGHINPAVTVSFLATKQISAKEAVGYLVSQLAGAIGGAIAANVLWGTEVISRGSGSVSGTGYIAECLAAGGLVAVIHGTIRGGSANRLPIVVPSFIAAASFAAPFGFANPAVAIAKSLAGGGPAIPALCGLLGCEIGAAIVAAISVKWLYETKTAAEEAPAPAMVSQEAIPHTYEIKCQPDSEEIVSMAERVVSRLIRPTDFLVRHSDGRLLALLESFDDKARSSLEMRANDHIALALLASEKPIASMSLVPAGHPVNTQ